MSEINNKSYRIKFEKTGMMKYISHLDLNRMFSRAFARAGIKIAHSEGFNPHPKIVFASAISLGVESLCELMDIKISEDEEITESQILEKSKNAFPNGINILEVYEPKTNFKYIDNTRYNIFIKPDGFGIEELEKIFEGEVFAEKKPGVVINLKDYILEINISGKDSEYKIIDVVVKTSTEKFLNPENIIKAINYKYTIDDYFIKKINVYDKNNAVFM